MATGSRIRQKPEPPKVAVLPREEQVRRRAHEIWLQRGGQDGAELDDWLQAEQEIFGSEPQRTAK